MTTVAWDGKTLAADRQSTIGTRKIVEPSPKIKRIQYNGSPALAGLAGNIDTAQLLMDWIDSGCEEDDYQVEEEDEVMVIQDGCVYMFNASGLHQKYGNLKWAIGSGGSFAIGALEHGATSVESVEIAIRLDIFSGYGIDFIHWDEKNA